MKRYLITAAIVFLTFICQPGFSQDSTSNLLVNTSHLDLLYEEISIDSTIMGIIHIYSDYPEYKWTGDNDEGIACVDDASRAAVFYIRNYQYKKDSLSLLKAERLIEFLLFMQSDNGYFYNFIFANHTINKTHKNSINQPGWWSWRAMWALSESYNIINKVNPLLGKKILLSLNKSLINVKQIFSLKGEINKNNGIELPSWLPDETASDQAGVLILSLVNYFRMTNDSTVFNVLNNLCDGILLMQKGTPSKVPYYAFLSWQNIWHAYGNIQSYAFLKASIILQRDDLKNAALNEIKYFYDYQLKQNFLSSFKLESDIDSFRFSDTNKFPQIAYNFRPMIFAAIEAFKLTGDSTYLSKAIKIGAWFMGNNVSCSQMYDPLSGICFDGINSATDVNLNSGAESTIEALLSMEILEQYGVNGDNLLHSISE